MGDAAREVRFHGGRVVVDLGRREARAHGEPVPLGHRALALLQRLLRQPGAVCPHDELMQAAWPGRVVSDGNLHVQMTALRKLLGDDALVNVRGRGYVLRLAPDPPPAGRLFGRDAQLAALTARLQQPGLRWLTLTGPGGVGKTRLAEALLQAPALADVERSRIDLAPLAEPLRVPAALLQALGLQPQGPVDAQALLAERLRGRRWLLLLDNLEHLADAAPWLQGLLEAAPQVQLLVTSRRPLHQPLEQVEPVEPLPGAASSASGTDALLSPALQLFLQRAADAGRPLAGDPAEHAAAVEICRHLGGLPLALELAAARLRLLTARELRDHLERPPHWLGAGRDAPAHRHRSLADSLQWSLDMLGAGAAELLPRLALARGGFTVEAARALDGTDRATTLDRLEVLVEHQLLQRQVGADGTLRFHVLEPVRDAAFERLTPDERAQAADRHAHHYADLATRTDPLLRSGARAAALAELAQEADNLRAALHRRVHEQRDATAALTLVGQLAWGWYFRGQLAEGRQWIAAALALPGDGSPAQQALRAHALSGDAKLALYLGDLATAGDRGAQAVALAREAGAPEVEAYALFHQAVPMQGKSPPLSLALYDEALALFRRLGNAWGEALATIYGGIPLAFAPDRAEAARTRLLDGKQRFLSLGDPWGASVADQYLAVMALRRGDADEAEHHLQAVGEAARALDDGFRIASTHHHLARVALLRGDEAAALNGYLDAAELHARQGRFGAAAQLLQAVARLIARRGDDRLAARLFGAALAERGPLVMQVFSPDELARCQEARLQLRQRLGNARHDRAARDGEGLGLLAALQLARRPA